MELAIQKSKIAALSEKFRFGVLDHNWSGCEAVWAFLERMASDGASVVIKIDGQRIPGKDSGRYTIVISGGELKEDFCRFDTETLDEALVRGILFYAERCWQLD